MKFNIDKNIFETFPGVLIGALTLTGIDNKGQSNDQLKALLQDAQKIAKSKLGDILVTEHPHVAPWREAYQKFGAKPKKYPSSIESLSRRVLRGNDVPCINALVDIYNLVSLKELVPVGGEDLDKIVGDLSLTFATADEKPVIVLGEQEPKKPEPGEVIYKDDEGTICRRWNWREVERASLTESTQNAILVIETLPPLERNDLERALSELVHLTREHCGGQAKTFILDSNNPSCLFE